jgi:hypothetical protein
MVGAHIASRYAYDGDYVTVLLSTGEIVLEHRFVMANYLGRELLDTEVVHHIDGDITNNDVENLELHTPESHVVLHFAERWALVKKVQLKCAQCGTEFERDARNVNYKMKCGQEHFFCSRRCGSLFQHAAQKLAGIDGTFEHGTRMGYDYYKCRCDLCKRAHRDAMRVWRDRKRDLKEVA